MYSQPHDMSQGSKRNLWVEGLHIAALWSIAVAHPIFEVLGENPEFFIAHDASPRGLIAFVLVICGVFPLATIFLLLIFSRLGTGVRTILSWSIVASLITLIALQSIKLVWDWDTSVTFSLSLAVGVGAASIYLWASSFRLFVTFLSPAIIVVPAVLFLKPDVSSLLKESNYGALLDLEFASRPPVVMVVFDQFPLSSLLDKDGQVDSTIYPNFASLAREASWFRNATAVADLTDLALPPLLTGMRPSIERLPVVEDYPVNLFTLFGSEYRLNVTEPITRLCPDSLCNQKSDSIPVWLQSVVPDVVVVYLHIVLPDALAERLPAVTQNWKNFAATNNTRGWWNQRREGDRQKSVTDFVKSLRASESDEFPPLYFLHVLLPHEPWIYLPSGQLYASSRNVVGLSSEGRWVDDELAVARNYQRHLLQARFSDALLGQVLNRLRQVGLWDDSLVVVTSDHGASFQPGKMFRRPDSFFAEIASVPLFIKEPNQQVGRIVSSNVEAVDVVPMIAGLIGVRLPEGLDGANVLDPDITNRPEKLLLYEDGAGEARGLANVEGEVAALVDQKLSRFKVLNGFPHPRLGLHDDLVGRPVEEFVLRPSSNVEVVVDFPSVFTDVELQGGFVPAHLTGAVIELNATRDRPILAVSLNGVVVGVTRPYAFPVSGRSDFWELIFDPDLVISGKNDLAIYVVNRNSGGEAVLELTYLSDAVDQTANVILDQAELSLGVTATGFFDTEWMGRRPFRWTGQEATLQVPIDQEALPVELVVDVLMTGPTSKSLSVTVNDCVLIEDEIKGAWRRAFSLEECDLQGDVIQVRLHSDVRAPIGADTRELGVAIGSVELR